LNNGPEIVKLIIPAYQLTEYSSTAVKRLVHVVAEHRKCVNTLTREI